MTSNSQPLAIKPSRSQFGDTVTTTRDLAERPPLGQLALSEANAMDHLSDEFKAHRGRLRATHARKLVDMSAKGGTQSLRHLMG